MAEGRGERATGTPNTIYDLASVLFHALEGGASYDQYIQDAEEEGDPELADFFRQVRDEDAMRADEAQVLLAERTPTAVVVEETVIADEDVDARFPPGTEPTGVTRDTDPIAGDVPPRTEPGAVAPGTESVPPRAEAPPPPEGQERSRRGERDQEEDEGLLEKIKEAVTGEDERERRERTDRSGR